MLKIKKLIKCILNLQYIRSYVKGVSPLFELSKLLKKINTIETLIDVGSNKGQFILITKKFFPNISIHSFEPLNEELSIQKSILKNNNIYYYNLALGNEENEDNIYITKRKDSSSLLKPKIGISEIYKTNEIRKIKISTIDKIFLNKNLKKPILLKLDVQGYEMNVLRGSNQYLRNIDYIICEISYSDVYEKQAMSDEIINHLNTNNFEIFERCNKTKFKGKYFQEDILFKKKIS